MKPLYLFLFLLFNNTFVCAQDRFYSDEILQKQTDSIRGIINSNPKQGLEEAEKFRLICQKKRNPLYEAAAMSLIDAVYMNTNDYKNLLKSSEQTILFSKKYKMYRETFEASTRKARALMYLGFLPEAEKIFKENILLTDQFNTTDIGLETVGIFWNDYSEFYNIQEKDNEGIQMLYKSLSYFQKIKDNKIRNLQLVGSYSNIGCLYLFQEKTDSAFYYFKKAEHLFPYAKNYNKRNEAMIFAGYGMGYNIKKQYKQAIPYLIKSLALCEKNNYPDIAVEILNQLSISYSKTGEDDLYYKKYLEAKEKYSRHNELTATEFDTIKKENSSFYDRNKYSIWSTSCFLVIGFSGIIFYQSKKRKKIEKEKEGISEIIKEQSKEISTLKTKVNNAFEEVLELAKKNDPTFLKRFSEVYPEFFTKLTSEFGELTNAQLKVLAFSFLNFNTKDIATIMNTSVRTTQTHKYRIRKIINITSEEGLIPWTQNFVG